MRATCAGLLTIAIVFVLTGTVGAAFAGDIEVLWLGHATTRITSVDGKVIVIDPYLRKNPKTPARYRDLQALGDVDLILITHGHDEHVADLVPLAKLTEAKVVASWEYALNVGALGIIDSSKMIAMNKGGAIAPLGPSIKIYMVPAEHSSGVDLYPLGKTPEPGKPRFFAGGTPVGYVVELENGFRIYHSGDTAVFGDMALIHEFYQPDLALLPIGGYFTMDPVQAAYAVRKLIKPKRVLPIHYGTYPIINRRPGELVEALGDWPVEVIIPKPGEAINFPE